MLVCICIPQMHIYACVLAVRRSHQNPPPPGPTRHPDLWFSDGSVVLRAENTLFRVHISQLSRHSAFFRDLFSLPQPMLKRQRSTSSTVDVDEGMQMEGCPVIVLHDAAQDVGNLLTALYDGPYVPFPSHHPKPRSHFDSNFGSNDQSDFTITSGILRLSTKYLIDSLRSKALAHLSLAWPLELKAWDAREDAARYEVDPEYGVNTSQRYPSPIAVINLANEINAPSLLPSAFYDLSRYSYTQIFEHASADDGTSSPLYSGPSTLSPSDMQKLALGKEASQQSITTLIQSMGNSASILHHPLPQHHTNHPHSINSTRRGSCSTSAACRKDFTELVDLATQHYLFDRERGCSDPLYVAEELGLLKSAEMMGSGGSGGGGGECKVCAKGLEIWAGKERERIWRLVPIWFRLEGF